MDFKKIAKQFWKEGYIVLEKFFPDGLMNEYNQKILEHFKSDPKSELTDEFSDKSKVQVIPWFPYREGKPYFDGVDLDHNFNQITTSILKESWNNLYCMMM